MDPYLIGFFGFADPYLMAYDKIENNININSKTGEVEFDLDSHDKCLHDDVNSNKKYK